ncbi:MAG: hypothetical protein WD749_06405 [Phycisphaerales bacterium]
MRTRDQIAAAAADALERAGPLPPALVGFDGFIDEITDAVDRRSDMTPEGYTRLRTIPALAARIGGAAGRSMNLELVIRERRWGGNGPLMAGALANLGAPVTYIGAVGDEEDPTRIHPLYEQFAARCREVIPLGPPATTHALEFEDGKVMLNKPRAVQAVTWERLLGALGRERLIATVRRARLLGMVNWSLMGGVEGIWRALIEEVLPAIPAPERPSVFVDLSDPAKRTDEDLRRAAAMLARMNSLTPVTLGLNRAEAERFAALHGLGLGGDDEEVPSFLQRAAVTLRGALALSCVVIHAHRGAGAAAAEGDRPVSAAFDGPFTPTPLISTGAGDHFNAGFAGARSIGLPLDESLAVACALAGAYVRDGHAPLRDRLLAFLRALPRPEPHPG